MIRKIITAETNVLALSLPDEYVGKQIEIIAFSLDENSENASYAPKKFTVASVEKELAARYKFNRDEANER